MLSGAFAAMLEAKGQSHLTERLFPPDVNLTPQKPNRRLPPHLSNQVSSSSSSLISSNPNPDHHHPRSAAVVSPEPDLNFGSMFPDDDSSLLEPLSPSPFAPPGVLGVPVPVLPLAEEPDPKPVLGDFSNLGAFNRALNAYEKRNFDLDRATGTKRRVAPPTEPDDDVMIVTVAKSHRTSETTSSSSSDPDFARACEASRKEGLREKVRRAERERQVLEELHSALRSPPVLLTVPGPTGTAVSSTSSSVSVSTSSATSSDSGHGSSSSSTSVPRPASRVSTNVTDQVPHPPVRPHPMQRLANLLKREGVPHSPLQR